MLCPLFVGFCGWWPDTFFSWFVLVRMAAETSLAAERLFVVEL